MKPVTDPELLSALDQADQKPSVPSPALKAIKDPSVLAQLDYGLDLSQPDDAVRKGISALPETEQKKAHDIWADYKVTKLRTGGFDQHPDAAVGIPLIGGFLDEATAGIQGGLNALTDGRIGMPYDEALAFERARQRQAEAAHPAEAATGQLAAGAVAAGPVASRIAPAATLIGRIGQGAAIGAGVGAEEGFARGEGSVGDRVEAAKASATGGAAIGGVLPIGGALATRAIGAVADRIGPRVRQYTRGADDAADEILARRIAREGSSPSQKRLDLQKGQAVDARLNANSTATLPETIADTSDAMQRLTGSLYRQGGEAGNEIRDALERRQRGPANPFGSRPANATPDGQAERIMDATERALLIRSSSTARQTERQIAADQARRGRELYNQARANSEPFDLQPALDGMALRAQDYGGEFRNALNRAISLFRNEFPNRRAVDNITRFDASKKALDDMIEGAQRQGQGNLVRELTQFKNSLFDAVHRVDTNGNPTANLLYREARQTWGTAAENREAIDLGRGALRSGSEIGAENYRELSPGQQQLFRLGFLESLRNALSQKRPGNDITQLFQQARVRELMNEIIPRPNGRNAVFANRQERFGNLLNREERMVQTRNAVLGNSATAQRAQDDAEFAGDALAGMWNRFRQSPSLFNIGVEAIGTGLQKIFGYRQDVALALSRRLLEADPTARNQILRRLRARGGPGRVQQLITQIDQSANALTATSAAQIPAPESE